MTKRSACLLLSSAAAAAALAVSATETSYVWDPSDRKTQFGIATVGYSESANTVTNISLSVSQSGGDRGVAFTGGNAFEFAEDATVSLGGGSLRFETPVSGGAFSLANGEETFCSTNTFNEWLHSKASKQYDLVFPGMTVAEVEFDSAWLWSGAVPSTVVYEGGFVERTETTLSAQFQMSHQGYSKGVRVTLVDGEGGICAYVNYARIVNKMPYAMSMDDINEVKANGGYGDLAIERDSVGSAGYGVRAVTVRRRAADDGNVMTVSNSVYSAGGATIGAGTRLVLDSLADGSVTTNFTLKDGGALHIRDMPGDVTLADGFRVDNGGRLTFEQPVLENALETLSTNVAPVLDSTAEKLLVRNVSVDNLVNWSVPSLVGSMTPSGVSDPVICFVRTNETAKTVQFQVQVKDNSLCKGCVVEFIERGGCIYARKVKSAYWSASDGAAGTVDILNPSPVTLTGTFTGDYYRPASFGLVYSKDVYLVEKAMTTKVDTTARLVLANTKVSDIRSIYVDHLCTSISTNKLPIYCFEKRTEDMIEFQLQVADDWTKSSKFQFYQNGLDVYGQKVMSCWTTKETAGAKSSDDEDYNYTGGKREHQNLYYIDQIYDLPSMILGVRELPRMSATIPAIRKDSVTNLTIDVGANVSLTVGSGSSLPTRGRVNVAGVLNVTNQNAIGTGEINVTSGGQLFLKGSNASEIYTEQTYVINGGKLVMMDDKSYMNTPVFMNGASVSKGSSSSEVRVGVRNMTWKVDGTSSSKCDVPLLCASAPTTGEYTMNWNVADVTGDDGVDFWMNAGMTEHPDGSSGDSISRNGGLTHKKTGAGTLRWGGQSTCTGTVQIVEGTLLLGVNGALNPGTSSMERLRAKQAVQLKGGTLASEAYVTNVALAVSVSTNASAIVLGEGASLSADAFGGFGEGGRLNVTLGEGATLRFGTALTDAELRRIRVNGNGRAGQDENGNIVNNGVPGAMIFIR